MDVLRHQCFWENAEYLFWIPMLRRIYVCLHCARTFVRRTVDLESSCTVCLPPLNFVAFATTIETGFETCSNVNASFVRWIVYYLDIPDWLRLFNCYFRSMLSCAFGTTKLSVWHATASRFCHRQNLHQQYIYSCWLTYAKSYCFYASF
jgi:hypothetical protein